MQSKKKKKKTFEKNGVNFSKLFFMAYVYKRIKNSSILLSFKFLLSQKISIILNNKYKLFIWIFKILKKFKRTA